MSNSALFQTSKPKTGSPGSGGATISIDTSNTAAAAAAGAGGGAKGGGKVDFVEQPYLRCPKPFACHNSLSLEWAFGVHKDYKAVIHNLSYVPPARDASAAGASGGQGGLSSLMKSGGANPSGGKRDAAVEEHKVFYPVAHVGVIYDAVKNTQMHLMGHAYTIVASCCSHNRRFVVTADEGDRARWGLRKALRETQRAQFLTQEEDFNATAEQEQRMVRDPREACQPEEDDDSLMIVWDTHTGLPVRSIPVGKYGGVVSCSMSMDGLYIATLNRRSPQEVAIWGWTLEQQPASDTDGEGSDRDGGGGGGEELAPEYVRRIPAQDEQTSIRFSTDDPHLLCTNGLRRVLFWSWSEGALKYYSPPILQKDIKAPVGNYTQTVLIPGTTLACSGTVDGDVVLWELQPKDRVTKEQDKTLLKMVRVHSGGVTFVTTEGGCIVTGGMDGHVRFLDTKLRLVAWYEELNGGPIISISFIRPTLPLEESLAEEHQRVNRNVLVEGTIAADQFTAPDFMVSTANAMIIDVPAKGFHTTDGEIQRGRLIVQGQDHAIQALATHPSLPRIAIAGLSGSLHLWDYLQRRVLMLSIFRNLLVQCLAFSPSADFLVVGFTNGHVRVLDANSLEERQVFKPSQPDAVTRIVFSPDSRMMATATVGGVVGLYEYVHHAHDRSKPKEWEFVGRHRTHRAPICGLQFLAGASGEALRLLSVGQDKRLIEYNLVESDAESGLLLRTAHKITQGPLPTGFLWTKEPSLLDARSRPRDVQGMMDEYSSEATPGDTTSNNNNNTAAHPKNPLDFLIITTNEYKFGIYTSDWSRQCVKTVLAPTFGGPVREMAVLPVGPDSEERCMVYTTEERVIGLVQLPLQGDPCAATGLIAHPGPITSMAVSFDGRYIFTAGGEDQSVLQWRVDGTAIMAPEERAAAAEVESGVPLDHLLATVEGGPEGDLMKEIVDYFYYAQIRAQGEETTAKRELLGAIHFSQLPNLMRALGYYPTELEIGHLTYEVANMYGARDEPLAELDVDAILLDFSQFMRLYVNYRPVFGITRQEIERAFAVIGADPATGRLPRDTFFQLLSSKGEPLHTTEITAALTSLLGDGVRVDMLEDYISARTFAENFLGFEDYDAHGEQEPEMEEEDEESDILDGDEGITF